MKSHATGLEIAVIGLSGRFPGADDVEQLWQNLSKGRHGISFFSEDEMAVALKEAAAQGKRVVNAKGVLNNIEYFDPAFFGYSPKEAEVMDPQMRVFHECVWEALENAGYDPDSYRGLIGLYAGASYNPWAGQLVLAGGRDFTESWKSIQFTNKDYLSTQIAYRLNLKGPCVIMDTACSTSLVAIDLACQGLLSARCDMALAGGIAITYHDRTGYVYQDGMIHSPDGYCRAFDAKAQGTVSGNGVGVVVLKRLDDAIADGDYIYAIIRGSAINNDGRRKLGFTAPSIEGQAEVIRMAHLAAEVEPESISFIEAHGTGTNMGDPVEVEALKQAFNTSKRRFCALGSIKTNIGHLDTAAGVAGFIKTVLALNHKLLPASLHFENPNAKIDFENSPFYVNSESREWQNGKYPLRAGVSSFGIGGTNAHVILEEAPKLDPSSSGRPWQVLTLSARSESALNTMSRNLLHFLETHNDVNLADVAYTLQVGRKSFEHRRMFLAPDISNAIAILKSSAAESFYDSYSRSEKRVVFLFPGQGAQYLNMGLELYENVGMFREEVDRCLDILKSLGEEHGFFSKTVSPTAIDQTHLAQPYIFVYEYALARLFMKLGVEPFAMLGHSIGEYVCACLAGVFTLEDALNIVSIRGKLMHEMRPGAMLSVPLSEEELQPLLNDIEIAAVNGPSQCVVSGSEEAIEKFSDQLQVYGKQGIRLRTSHAYHSRMMAPILKTFVSAFSQVRLSKPQIPYLSNVTGQWITSEDATDPAYWSKHLRNTVRFADAINILRADPDTIFLEAGPGKALSFFVKQSLQSGDAHCTVNLMPAVSENQSEIYCLLRSIGQLWVYGACINWKDFNAAEKRLRLPLPTYPFAKEYFPLDETVYSQLAQTAGSSTDNDVHFYVRIWNQSARFQKKRPENRKSSWIVFVNEGSQAIFADLRLRIEDAGHEIYTINIGAKHRKIDRHSFIINPDAENDYETLLSQLLQKDENPKRILFLWSLSEIAESETQTDGLMRNHDLGFHSLMYIAKAVGRQKIATTIHITVVTNGVLSVTGEECLAPVRATILGAVKTIPLEYANISLSTIDVDLDKQSNFADHLFQEILFASADEVVALRKGQTYLPEFEKLEINAFPHNGILLREQGVYLITGGLGGIGLELAKMLAQRYRAKLILSARSPLPPKEKWNELVLNHIDDKTRSLINTLIALEDSGAEVLALSADVADMGQMSQARRLAIERFGQIHGVIHCAGVPGGELIQTLTREKTESVFSPKIKGSLVLEAVFTETPLDFVILCSSLSSLMGSIGQASYSAANAFIDAFAHYKNRRGNVHTLSINWDAWRETGMAVAARKNLLERLESKLVEIDHSIFKGYEEQDNERIYHLCLSPKQNWMLDEHRIMGKATLPGTAYLELARAAIQHFTDHSYVELHQVLFLTPLVVEDTDERPVRLIIKKAESDFDFRVQSQFQNDGWQDHCQGRIRLLDPVKPPKIDLAKLAAQCNRREVDVFDGNEDFFNNQFQKVGLRWSNLRKISYGENCGLARIELASEFANDVDVNSLHPAILDTATGFLSREVNKKDGYLPFFYKSIRILSPLPPAVYSYASHRVNPASSDLETLAFDIVITDDTGKKLVEIEEYTFKRVHSESYLQSAAPAGDLENTSLIISTPGNLDTLKYVPSGRTNPGPGEVEIEVFATGLNFKEVLMALGMVPAPGAESFKFGLECAGKISSCGEGVADFKVGDEVVALGSGCFSRFVALPALYVAYKPPNLSMVEAATVPVPFLTAYYALITMGRLSKGEKVLIHSAAGGVGMAAVQIAKWVGAEIFATAGNPEKQKYLQSLGIKYVMDSRSLAFADEVMKYTNNQGVDVLLNSLSGEFVTKGLSIMASGGRFIEIGVRDIFEDKKIGMRAFARGLSLIAIDEIKNRDVIHSAMQKIVQHLQKNDFVPLRPNVFKRDDITAAFKYMAQARHIGKIVVVHKDSAQQSIRRNSAAASGLQDGLLSKQGVIAFRRILEGYPINHGKSPAQIVVTSRDGLQKKSQFGNSARDNLLKTVKPAQKSIRPRPQLSASYVTPRNDVEHSVAAIIQDYLGYDKLGIDDNFFELGLSSLDIIQINEKLKNLFHKDLAVVTMFSYPTIGTLSAFLLNGTDSDEKQPLAEKADFAEPERLLRHSIDTFKKL